jgi:hypothetical protein
MEGRENVSLLTPLSQTLPFAFASGINLYATVAVLGLCARFDLVDLPPQFQAFDNPYVIAGALAMYLVEFVADKVPWVDSMWDVVHTVVRPIGGALVAITALGDASPGLETLAALMGGSVALATHATKAGTRAVANASPEPFTNWFLSLAEDIFVVGLSYVALEHPLIALAVVLVLLALIVALASVIVRALLRRFAAPAG